MADLDGIEERDEETPLPFSGPFASANLHSRSRAASKSIRSRSKGSRRVTLERSLSRSLTALASFGGSSWAGADNMFGEAEMRRDAERDDEEALKWAALQRLPTYDRIRTSVIATASKSGRKTFYEQVDVTKLGFEDRRRLIDKLLAVAQDDNEAFLQKLRSRIDKVGIRLPTVEVRYEHLSVEGDVFVGNRNLPTLLNTLRTILEGALQVVGLSRSKKRKLRILKDVSGILEPGRIALLLGPPASGKSSFLLALASRLSPSLRVQGKVTYNGTDLSQFVPQKTSAYIGQTDLHIADMTVRETLDFSAWCQGVGSKYGILTELLRKEKEAGILPDDADIDLYLKATAIEGVKSSIITDYTLKILGLDVCADIMIGDNLKRGISGGQKKRVTTGEMIVGPTKTLFMDEISTGLDSSTTFQIVKCLQQFVHILNATVVISLLQPPPETYELFDDIILLAEGQIVYHGPREYVLPFFEHCGFRCPKRKGVADFLQEVISKKDQQQYWYSQRRAYHYVSPKAFGDKFQQFHVGRGLAARLDSRFDKPVSDLPALAVEKYSISKWELLKANWKKEMLLMKRSGVVYVVKGMQIFIVAIVTGTVFTRTRMDPDNLPDGQIYLLALFYGLVVVMFNGTAEVSLTMARLPVFFKQRDLKLYPAWAYAIPSILLRIPLSLFESFLFTAITYFLVGYSPEASRFFKQFLAFFLEHTTSASVFRSVAALSRSMVVANTAGFVALMIILTCGGFIIPRPNIPHWWIWAYWCSPLAYVETALSVNELLSPQWMKRNATTATGETKPLGVVLLESRGLWSKDYWYWISVAALVGFIIFFNTVYTLALTYLHPLNKAQATISEEEEDDKGNGELSDAEAPLANGTGLYASEKVERSTSRSGSVHHRDTVVEASVLAQKQGQVLPFTPLAMSFDSVCYSVDMPPEMRQQGINEDTLELLHDINGVFRPGTLTALMGVSGAGKTTLMDVLAGRKTGGYIDGEVRISGFVKNQDTFARVSGYCEQFDIHSPQVTVHESLIFSAWLRLSHDIPQETKMAFVEEVMELVELTPLRDALVGLPGVSGLSTEQRKRLTIAVELVANPAIIFMDEPTSGLDARAAAVVMRAVRNTVDTGRTVVCTIHQPSIDIFEAFDELLLLKRGGHVIYGGPLGRNSEKLIEYFEAIPGIQKMKEGTNPATWMLEVSSLAAEGSLGVDFAEIYERSSLYKQTEALVKKFSVPPPGAQDLYFPTRYSLPFFDQLQTCLWKQMWSYWRSPGYNLARFAFTFFASVLLGTIFLQVGKSIDSQQDLLNVMGAIFGGTTFMGINNALSVQPQVSVERSVFYRERGAGLYSPMAYALSQVLIEIPFIMYQSVSHTVIAYSLIGYFWVASKFIWYLYITFCTFMSFTFYGMMMVAITPNLQLAAIVSSSFYFIFNLFSGFIIPRPKIPPWWLWLYWICPTGWTVTGLFTSQYSDVEKTVSVPTGGEIQVNKFLKDRFGFEKSFLPVVGVVVLAFPVLFASLFLFATKKINFQRR